MHEYTSACNEVRPVNFVFWPHCFICPGVSLKSRDSSVGLALGYGLEDRGSRV
jgi:hypothetical protein